MTSAISRYTWARINRHGHHRHHTFNAPPERVWALLMDPAAIASCIPGCDSLEPDGEDRYTAALTVGMAAITGTYEGTVTITDKVPPRRTGSRSKARAGRDS